MKLPPFPWALGCAITVVFFSAWVIALYLGAPADIRWVFIVLENIGVGIMFGAVLRRGRDR